MRRGGQEDEGRRDKRAVDHAGGGGYSITQRIRSQITEDHIRAGAAVTEYLGWHSTRLERREA